MAGGPLTSAEAGQDFVGKSAQARNTVDAEFGIDFGQD